ncbi:MAG TPA: MmgE/PrpD family protein [Streptosporangiaceae bacterium]
MGVTKDLAAWVSGVAYPGLTAAAVERVQVAVLDYLGCTVAGSTTETARKLRAFVADTGSGGNSTVVGTMLRAAPPDAALLNGTFGHAQDYDDVSFHMIGHPGVTILPAVLALAETTGRSGADAIAAYAAGYEVATRLGYAMNAGGHYEKGWHATGTLGTMGAAAGASNILGLDAGATAHALGIAASMAAGLRQNFGRDTKPLHAGRAAQNGVTAAMLAARGFTADPDILEAPFGFLSVYSGPDKNHADRLTPQENGEFEVAAPGFQTKIYPSCASTHTALDAMLSLIAEHGIDAGKVAEIDVAVVHLTPKILIHTDPAEGLQGKFSMQYCMARALTSRFLGVGHFTDEAVRDPGIRRLMGLVRMHVDAGLDAAWSADRPRPVIITVTMDDGTVLRRRVDIPTGLPEKPATAAQVEAKYRDLAVPVLGGDGADRVIGLARELRDLPDVSVLMSACTAG